MSNTAVLSRDPKQTAYTIAIQKRNEPALAHTVYSSTHTTSSLLQTARDLYEIRYLRGRMDRFLSWFTRIEVGTARIARQARLQRTHVDLSLSTFDAELADYIVDSVMTDAYYRRLEVRMDLRKMFEDPFFSSSSGASRNYPSSSSPVLVLRIVPNKTLLLWGSLILVVAFFVAGIVCGVVTGEVEVGVGIAGGGFAMVAVFHALIVWVSS